MLTVRSAQEILTIVETIPILKEWENLFRDRNGADSGSSFCGDYFEISFLKIDILFLEVEEFADSASGIYQHENDSIIWQKDILYICPPKMASYCVTDCNNFGFKQRNNLIMLNDKYDYADFGDKE